MYQTWKKLSQSIHYLPTYLPNHVCSVSKVGTQTYLADSIILRACSLQKAFLCSYLGLKFVKLRSHCTQSAAESSIDYLENANLRGSTYHCMSDLLFILFGFSCFFLLNEQQLYLFGQFQTSQTGVQAYSDTSPHGECSLDYIFHCGSF